MTGLPQLLIIAVVVCTLSRQLSSMESEGGSWAAPTAEELASMGIESQFSLSM